MRSTADNDPVLPQVALPASNRTSWLFGIGLAAAGLMLFNSLETRRSATEASIVRPTADTGNAIAAPPALDIPIPASQPSPEFTDPLRAQRLSLPQIASPARTLKNSEAMPVPGSQLTGPPPQPLMSVTRSDSAISPAWQTPAARQSGTSAFAGPRPDGDGFGDRTEGKDRVQATRLKDPATTVPKGVVIQAVLETALDSSRAGFARAIVSRDVHAFDGSQVLIPRGSQLVGEYKADLTLGQKRVLVQWQRLMRPDGVLMNLDSPAADPLGRAGVGGKVNSHFFERFAGSILQSTLNIGAQLASQRVSRETYVVALPGTTGQGLVAPQGDKIAPTVKVRQGSSVSVFVARDLDFTVSEQ
ncbi:type IV secretion system protein VirB10 [Sphingomonas sp. PP-F2F-G114-C0414]|nr:type IV secretion system protein VirB10 [Sphingomonas sp. PP-F2F-G114-C0414]